MKIKRYLVPFIFGLIGILSFAPFSIKPLIFLSYAYLINGLLKNNKESIIKLICWSFGHWGFGMSWLIVSVYYYGNTHILLALVIFILLIAILTLVFSAPLLLLKIKLFNNIKYANFYTILYVGSILFIYWQLFWDCHGKKNKIISVVVLAVILILLIPRSEEEIDKNNLLNISIVQPSTNPFLKYENNYKDKIEENLLRLSKEINTETDLVIFPEAELPYAYESIEFSLFKERLINSKTIITGSWHFEGSNLFNSMVNLDTGQIYNKQHLVPFGEYIPFIPSLRGLISFFDMPMSNVSHGANNQGTMNFTNNDQAFTISPLICYDIAFGNTVRKSNKSSNFIINISNDTWFGNSIGPYHHLDIARVRAIENNKWLIRATNDGFSAVISNKGVIVDKMEKGISGVMNSRISTRYTAPTAYSSGGYFIPYVLALILTFLSAIINLCIKRPSSH